MANEYLKRTPTSTGNRRVFTWSFWVKRSDIELTGTVTQPAMFRTGNTYFRFESNSGQEDGINFSAYNSTNATSIAKLKSESRYRDVGNWMHCMVSYNSTIGTFGVTSTESRRIKIYVNGSLVDKFISGQENYPDANDEAYMSTAGGEIKIGVGDIPGAEYFEGEMFDVYMVDGQALTPDVFGFYKEGKGYISAGSTQATDFRNGQWVPRTPREIKNLINDNGGFGVNGFYLPMNDSSNFGADFHTTPNSIIKLGDNLPQPKVSIASTAQAGLAYTDVLREDPYAANLVLAIPFVNSGLCTNGTNSGINTGFGDYSHIINSSQTAKDVQVITYNGTTPTIVSAGSSSTNYYGSACYIDGNGSAHAGGHIRVVDDTIFDNLNLRTANWTIEGWFNPASRPSGGSNLFNFGDATDYNQIQVILDSAGDPWHLWSYTGSAWNVNDAGTTARPPLNQWSHIAVEKVGTGTTSHITTYVNGVAAKVTAVPQDINYSSNPRLILGGHYISGESSGGDTFYYDGLISDVRMYNVAKYKGGFDVPKPYTPVGIGTWRAVPDTCQNNFATLNAIDVGGSSGSGLNVVLSNGNLTITTDGTPIQAKRGNFPVSSGKWYFEIIDTAALGTTLQNDGIGVVAPAAAGFNGTTLGGYAIIYRDGGGAFLGNENSRSDPAAGTHPTWTGSDFIGVALNIDNRYVEFFKNGVSAAKYDFPSHITSGEEWVSETFLRQSDALFHHNFGQNPTFSGNTTAGTFTDSNSKGLFKYQPPTGFLALCEDNLPTPTIKDPGEYFKTVLWTGDGNSGHSIAGVGFTPDFVWIKERTSTSGHHLYDSVRGPLKYLVSSSTQVENEVSTHLSSFDNDGFTLGTSGGINEDSQNYVAWCWKAGGPAVTNTNGSITSQVSANQTAGFSIVSYTGNATGGSTVGHGLGKKPSFVIAKGREVTNNWLVWHKGLTAEDYYLHLETTGSQVQNSAFFSAFSDTTFTLGNSAHINSSSKKNIAYCWAEIEGFSKFGSYVGNGNADGPFVYCGFKPAWVMYKRTDTTGDWAICDSSRNSTNPLTLRLFANNTNTDTTGVDPFDFVSNGFKFRTDAGSANASAGTYIFAAFAESPFQTANAK